MSAYRVSVFKTLLSSDGHPFKCLQFAIDVARAKSSQRAIEAARWRYQRRVKAPDWTCIAETVEVKDMDTHAPARPRSGRGSYRRRKAPTPRMFACDSLSGGA